jgi:hypothetical protein
MRVSMGDRGCLSLFGNQSESHRMFDEQVTAEYFVNTEGRLNLLYLCGGLRAWPKPNDRKPLRLSQVRDRQEY